MSGFLQRLASGVLHAQPAIHPAVGTIWSTAGMNGPGMKEPLATQRGLPIRSCHRGRSINPPVGIGSVIATRGIQAAPSAAEARQDHG